jgi:hypothetical protein
MFITLLMLLTNAHAVDDIAVNELSVEVGYLDGGDLHSYMIQNGRSFGLRGGYGLNSWLTLIGSWHMSSTKTAFRDPYYDDYGYDSDYNTEDYYGQEGVFNTTLRSHEFTVGPKVDWSVSKRFHPYATTQLMVNRMHLSINDSLDDDPMIDIRGGGFGVGGLASGGLEYRSRPMSSGVQLASHMEFGYGISSKINFDNMKNNDGDYSEIDAGDLSMEGLYFRFGVGVRF